MKKLVAILLIFCALFFSSCDIQGSIDNAKVFSENFVKTLDDDLDNARIYLHPDFWPGEERLDAFINQLERANDIDFSDGVEIVNCEWRAYGVYDGNYDGSLYKYSFELSVGEKLITMFVLVIENNKGYGVKYFGVDPNLK